MAWCFQLPLQTLVAAVTWLLLLPLVGAAEGQTLRGPDLGLWFSYEPDNDGPSGLVVERVLEDGPFAVAGLREGDRVLSVDGQAIDGEAQFVRAMMRSSNGDQVVTLVATRTVLSGTIPNTKAELQTISLTTRDVWKGVVAADPFYQAGFLVDEGDVVVATRVFPLTPAFYAGLRQADSITSVSGQSVTTPADVARFFRIGGRLAIGVTRGAETRQLHILLPGRSFSATTYPPAGRVQPPSPQVPVLQPPPPLLIPPQIPGALSPIPSALPRVP